MAKDTAFYELAVADVTSETPDALSIYFDIPEELRDKFEFKAGQYLTLKVIVNGKEERRSYSMCTMPGDNKPGITVKRVKNGKVSNYICDNYKAGYKVHVMPPDGRFIVDPDPERKATYYMFGAGSGITPLMSQINAILEHEPMSTVHLYYGNKGSQSIIFKQSLDNLQSMYKGQLTIDHILSRAGKGKILGGLFGKKQDPQWTGETGRINEDRVLKFLEKYPNVNSEARYHICGPGDMINNVRRGLKQANVKEDEIHTEFFTAADTDKPANGSAEGNFVPSKAVVTLRGENIEIEIGNKSILDTLEEAGYDAPYSCTSGACATCMAKVTKGSARMEMCFALSDDEIEEGFILTCQSHPTSEEIELTFDV